MYMLFDILLLFQPLIVTIKYNFNMDVFMKGIVLLAQPIQIQIYISPW
jgi:hypothetical protein